MSATRTIKWHELPVVQSQAQAQELSSLVYRFTNCRVLQVQGADSTAPDAPAPLVTKAEDVWVCDGVTIDPITRFFAVAGSDASACDVCVDCEGHILAPGFIDVQINGAYGVDFSDVHASVDDIRRVCTKLLAHGVTSICPTLVSSSTETYTATLPTLRAAMSDTSRPPCARMLGLHLEGPFIAPARKGAHAEANLRRFDTLGFADVSPDASSTATPSGSVRPVPAEPEACIQPFSALLDAYGSPQLEDGEVRIVTLAPELPGALSAIRALSRAGVCVSIGHTDADIRSADRGVAAGACLITHLFNAMSAFHHRDPGVVGLLGRMYAGGAVALAGRAKHVPDTRAWVSAYVPVDTAADAALVASGAASAISMAYEEGSAPSMRDSAAVASPPSGGRQHWTKRGERADVHASPPAAVAARPSTPASDRGTSPPRFVSSEKQRSHAPGGRALKVATAAVPPIAGGHDSAAAFYAQSPSAAGSKAAVDASVAGSPYAYGLAVSVPGNGGVSPVPLPLASNGGSFSIHSLVPGAVAHAAVPSVPRPFKFTVRSSLARSAAAGASVASAPTRPPPRVSSFAAAASRVPSMSSFTAAAGGCVTPYTRAPYPPRVPLAEWGYDIGRPFYSLICDGVHVHPYAVAMAHATHREGLILVTDAMKALGLPPGRHTLGELDVDIFHGLEDGHYEGLHAVLADTVTLAGAVVPLDACVRNLMAFTRMTLAEAVASVTTHPARALRVHGVLGDLRPGRWADMCLLSDTDGDRNARVLATFMAGHAVWSSATPPVAAEAVA